MIKLTMDNGSCSDGIKKTVTLTEEELGYHARNFFGWRTPKGYKSYADRVRNLGSTSYDKFILYCSKL